MKIAFLLSIDYLWKLIGNAKTSWKISPSREFRKFVFIVQCKRKFIFCPILLLITYHFRQWDKTLVITEYVFRNAQEYGPSNFNLRNRLFILHYLNYELHNYTIDFNISAKSHREDKECNLWKIWKWAQEF